MTIAGTVLVAGKRYRWSFCDGPHWCCGGEGVYAGKYTADGHSYVAMVNDAEQLDGWDLTDPPLRVEEL